MVTSGVTRFSHMQIAYMEYFGFGSLNSKGEGGAAVTFTHCFAPLADHAPCTTAVEFIQMTPHFRANTTGTTPYL